MCVNKVGAGIGRSYSHIAIPFFLACTKDKLKGYDPLTICEQIWVGINRWQFSERMMASFVAARKLVIVYYQMKNQIGYLYAQKKKQEAIK